MKIILLNNFLLLFVIILFSPTHQQDIYYNHTSSENNLYFVFSTFRHGARSTYYQYDYFGNKIDSPASLTPYGATQHLEIGKAYRERYSNFLNLSFDPNQIYARSTEVERTIISTLKELEGLFEKNFTKEDLHLIKDGHSFWNLFQFNDTEKEEFNKYMQYCNKKKRRLKPNMGPIFYILRDCFGAKKHPNFDIFCDATFAAYYDYAYGNNTENKIGKCGREYADRMHNFCKERYNKFKGWDENSAYMFYIMFQNIIKHMVNAIEGKSELKMFMVGGHDITLNPLMNFLDGMKIARKTQFPYYAFNIVIELRKYNDDFFLEFYYNDVLKYNQTLETFMDTLDKTKYSNLYNKCGIPPWMMEINTTNIIEIESTSELREEISMTQPIVNISSKEINPSTQIIKETSHKEEISLTQKNELENNIKTEKIMTTQNIEVEETAKKEEISITKEIPSTIINKQEIQNLEIENSDLIKKNNETQNNKELLMNKADIIQGNKTINFTSTFQFVKTKLEKIFKQKRQRNLFIISISIIASICVVIFIICLCRFLKKRKKFVKLAEEQSKNKEDDNVNNNFGVLSVENSKDEHPK